MRRLVVSDLCAGNEGSRLWAGNEMKSKETRRWIIRIRCRIKATIYGKWIWVVRIRSSSLETCDNGTLAGRRNREMRRNWDRIRWSNEAIGQRWNRGRYECSEVPLQCVGETSLLPLVRAHLPVGWMQLIKLGNKFMSYFILVFSLEPRTYLDVRIQTFL